MPQLKNRRGLSEVIATLLIILLSVALIAVVAQYIIPFVKNSLNKSGECLNYRDSYKFREDLGDLRYNCYTSDRTGFSIQTDSGLDNSSELSGFDLVLIEEGSSKKLSIRNGISETSDLRMLNKSLTNLQIPLRGEVRTYVHEKQSGENQFVSMEVYPVLSSGRVCEASDKIKLTQCSSLVNLNVI